MRETVPAALAGERVDRVVALMTGHSRSAVAGLISTGGVRVGGDRVGAGSRRVAEGDVVEVELAEAAPAPAVAADPSIPITVVFEDESVIVVDKAAGLVVHPGGGVHAGTLVDGLLARYPELVGVGQPDRPGIVHRLDKGTSGLLVVARQPDAYERLVAMLAARDVTRRYVALVWGVPDNPRGVIDAPIGRSARDRTRMAVIATGREARTHYELEVAYAKPVACARLRCTLETGRTHQIRVHLAAIDHPVVGDAEYRGARHGLRAPRPMLHAAELAFAHPVTGAPLHFESPIASDMAAVLATLS